MTRLSIGNKVVDCKAIIFDKDGTLIDFSYTWRRIAEERVNVMVKNFGIAQKIGKIILKVFGLNPQTGEIDPRGPLVMSTQAESVIIGATILYQNGYHWDEAQKIVEKSFKIVDERCELKNITKPVANLRESLTKFKENGLKLAIATVDNYWRIVKTLEILGIGELIDTVVGGDNKIPNKPHSEMVWAICRQLKVKPRETVIVGDAIADMLMGKNAGVRLTIGVSTGVTKAEVLKKYSDVVINSLADIKVIASISITGPTSRLIRTRIEEVKDYVIDTAKKISLRFSNHE